MGKKVEKEKNILTDDLFKDIINLILKISENIFIICQPLFFLNYFHYLI